MESLNLHINYACPLNCRYCIQRTEPQIHHLQLTAEQMVEKVRGFLNQIGKDRCVVNISGGEPLLKFNDVQHLMRTFPNNSYEISTSGYLLTQDKLEFFSHFDVFFILSVDGTEKVTKYLRPTVNGKNDYFEKLKQNIPALLYYFPRARAKLIVSKRLINEVFNTYLELERLGFKEIFITPNVYENEVDSEEGKELSTGVWEEKDWKAFEDQIDKITTEIILGMQNNFNRCLITNINAPISKMLTPADEEIDKTKMICRVLDLKGGSGPEGGDFVDTYDISQCIYDKHPKLKTQEQLVKMAADDFKKIGNICPYDEKCPFFKSCKYSTCLAENIQSGMENIWMPTPFQCKTQKIYHKQAVKVWANLAPVHTRVAERFKEMARQDRGTF